MRNYSLAMGLRVACFIAMLVIPNTPARIALIAMAAFLPGAAVLLANAVDRRQRPHAHEVTTETHPVGALTDHRVISIDPDED